MLRFASKTARRLRRDERGSYVMEFALLLVPLLTLLTGTIELGYFAYAKALTEGTIRQAGRMATTGNSTAEQIETFVRAQLAILHPTDVDISVRSYSDFGDVEQPEPLTSDVEPLGGTPGSGDCYLDLNGDGSWSSDSGSSGIGSSEEIVYYGVSVEYSMLFTAFGGLFRNGNTNFRIDANSIVKNEPFGAASAPAATACIA